MNNKVPKKVSHCVCLLVTSIDSVFKTVKANNPKVFLEDYKFIVNEKDDLMYY